MIELKIESATKGTGLVECAKFDPQPRAWKGYSQVAAPSTKSQGYRSGLIVIRDNVRHSAGSQRDRDGAVKRRYLHAK